MPPLSLCCVTSQCSQIDGKYTPLTANLWTKWYGWMVHTMNELIVSSQCWAGSADDDINFLLVTPTLTLLCHVTMPSNWWQIHPTEGKSMGKTISMDSQHHGQFYDIVSVLGRVSWRWYDFLLVADENYSWQLYGVHDGEMDGWGSNIGPRP